VRRIEWVASGAAGLRHIQTETLPAITIAIVGRPWSVVNIESEIRLTDAPSCNFLLGDWRCTDDMQFVTNERALQRLN
jgi:hypothetical protein